MANMFDENGNYNKTEWKPGDRITAGKLNKIEESLEAINNNDIERHKEADERLDALEEQNEAVEERFDELEDLVADNKSEVDTAIYEVHSKMDRLEQEMNDGIDTVEAIAHTVDDKIADADASMKAQVAEVEADLEGLHAKDEELSEQLADIENNMVSVNIKEFGAVGDGVTDDTAAINGAIEFAYNNNIYNVIVPSGVYMINADLTETDRNTGGIRIKSNINLLMSDTTILKSIVSTAEYYNVISAVKCNNFTISGGTIQCDKNREDGNKGQGIGIYVQDCSNSSIKNILIKDALGDGIIVCNSYEAGGKSDKIILQNITIDGARRNGLSILVAQDIDIHNCTFTNNGTIDPKYAIDIEPDYDWNHDDTRNINIRNCIFENNTNGIMTAGDTAFLKYHIILENNYFNHPNTNCFILNNNYKNVKILNNTFINSGYPAITIFDPSNVIISNNSFKGSGTSSSAINLRTLPEGPIDNGNLIISSNIIEGYDVGMYIRLNGVNNIVNITNNQFRTSLTRHMLISTGEQYNSVSVNNNSFYSAKNHIYLANGVGYSSITNNVFLDCTGSYIYTEAVRNMKVKNNIFENNNTEVESKSQMIFLGFGSMYNIFEGNIFSDNNANYTINSSTASKSIVINNTSRYDVPMKLLASDVTINNNNISF